MDSLAAVPMLDVFLNYACQAKCPFCYNPALTPELVRWRLPLRRLARELLDGRRAGCRGVTFSGGEVTLIEDLPKLLRLARRAGYEPVGIITNGLRLAQPAYLDSLLEAGLGFCCLSVHGADAALHDRMVRVSGAFAKALAALDGLEARGVPVALNFVLTRENAGAAAAFAERFAPRPGVVELQFYYPHYDGLMAEHAAKLKLSMGEAVPHLCDALDAAERAGAAEKVWIHNMPPCAARGLGERLRNWEREPDALLVDPKGLAGGGFLPERRERVKNAECRSCRFDARCLGFERGYVDRFGDGLIRAVP